MPLHKHPIAVFCALVLALGLAACGGGGGSSQTDKPGPAAVQLAEIDEAIEAAKTAVNALDDASTDAGIAAAGKALAAARTAVTDAASLSVAARAAYLTAIELMEESFGEAGSRIASVRAAQAGKLIAAFDGPGIAAIGAAVTHGAAPAMAGTIPGTPAMAVTGLETAAVAGSAPTAGTWTGGAYTAADEEAGIMDTVVIYTNIEAPGTRPFSGETGKYSAANDLDGDGNLPIVAGTDATLIASSAFPTAPGIRTHEAGEDDTVSIAGAFDDASGAYVCTPAAESACTSSIRHGGGIALAGGGGWKFVPAAGAAVPKPDTEYQYFGWWLRDTGDSYAAGGFHAGMGSAADEFAGLAAVQGTVTYRGPAAGKFAIDPPIGAASSGDFTATATLEADFGDGSARGTVEGTVDGFMVDGAAMPWSVALQAAGIGAEGAIAASGADTAHTAWSIGDREGAAPAAGLPTWEGRFHEVGEDRVPAVATGTFEAAYGDIGRMVGAFGTRRQQ